MQEFLSVIRSSTLFSGISEQELTAMLACLGTKASRFPKDALLLRAGDTAESIGLVLSGSVLVEQEDVWGNRNILSKAGPGQTLRRRLCLRTRFGAEGERRGGNTRDCAVSERQTRADHVPVRLRPAQPHHPQSSRRACRKEPAVR